MPVSLQGGGDKNPLSRRLSNRFPDIENSYICGDLKTDHARKEGCGGGFLGQEAPFTGLT